MNDHVAVLRRLVLKLRDDDLLAERLHPDTITAIDHAIAAVAECDALVARLGELEKAWRDNYEILPSQWFATQLDRVVAGNGGGE